ncbi:uncharacterized protein [Neodiprion pinetum]|uniref:Uncharacterized protein LOC107218135 n=1 Tax=Neodiprion lecontei TaxID=441921 RepID=A0A6J0B8U0_NEOLC|nr:uncharacterized protein LOC107218135 [Neodiprion lecontei]XP_046413098.1 uncharacterized protein LOC124176198 [Neodiprion fabricii]XP_046468204.1 uncharacterized protein LOC124212343 [Neodiprion pinetum]XP_046604229.1 uncharacterized protein LOC124297349 [Neodiprion virginianus]
MARPIYECNFGLRSENYTASGPIFCTINKQYCCNSQCCLVQRRPTRQLWEAWYFWLGLALLALFLLTSVSSYLVSSCRHNLHAAPFGFSNQRSLSRDGQNGANSPNQISVNVIATPETLSPHRKMVLVAPRASLTHMTPVVA